MFYHSHVMWQCKMSFAAINLQLSKWIKNCLKSCSLVYLLYSSTVSVSPLPTFANPIRNVISTPSQSLRYPVMKAVFWVWCFFVFNLRFAARIFKVGLTPENNQRRVWLHSQPHPEQHSNFTVSTKMKTDVARSSFRHKQGKGWALQRNKGFPFQAKTP